MFSVREKRMISEAVQQILRSTRHPELPDDEIRFQLVVRGKEQWSWADIRNNGAVPEPGVNPHNEAQDQGSEIKVRQGTGKDLVDPKRWAEIIQEGGEVINMHLGSNVLGHDLMKIAGMIRTVDLQSQ